MTLRKTVRESGLSEFLRMVKHADLQSQRTPRSLSGGDTLFLPIILRDFPEFHLQFAKSEIGNNIVGIFNYINGEHFQGKEKVQAFADTLKERYEQKAVSNDRVHKTCISNYVKTQGTATIQFQTAFQFDYQDERRGRLTAQERYETDYTYLIQENRMEDGEHAVSVRCGYCGAPMESVGAKLCAYCGTALDVIQDRAWQITGVNMK